MIEGIACLVDHSMPILQSVLRIDSEQIFFSLEGTRMGASFLSTPCGATLVTCLDQLWSFFTSAQGQATFAAIAFFQKLLMRLLRSSRLEERQFGQVILALAFTLILIGVTDFHVVRLPKTFAACLSSNNKIVILDTGISRLRSRGQKSQIG